MYDVYLQYGHNSPEYEDLIRQKAEADSELREEENGKDWIIILICCIGQRVEEVQEGELGGIHGIHWIQG